MAGELIMPAHLSIYTVAGAAAGAGFLSHWLYFIRGEHHLQAARLMTLSMALPVLCFAGLWQYTDLGVIQAALGAAQIVATYTVSLWTSVLVYRLFFHRLRKFPGQFMAKATKLWHVGKLVPKIDNFRLLDELHCRYGDFVRTGPSEISIFNPEAVPTLLGPGSKCTKSPWYDVSLPLVSMHTTRDKVAHDRRRRIWDRGFSTKALKNYEDRILRYSRDLLEQIGAQTGKTVNATAWLHYYSFDVMGDLAFGKSFEMLKNGKTHEALDLLAEGMKPLGLLTPVPWVFCILATVPGLGKGFKKFVAWCEEQVENRKKINMEVPDVMSLLIEASEKSSKESIESERLWLAGDARLIIVAGSDTTAATLTYILYHLAKDPSQVEKLRAEVKSLIKSGADFSVKDLQAAEHLNGVINETLRLHPPVPSGALRITPPEGITIGDTFIPGDVTVVAPVYTLGRLASCYERPTEFIPERWYSQPQLVKNRVGFAPFSLGPFSCVGKQIALMELRTVIALLVNEFDVRFAPGEDGSRLLQDSQDFFTVSLADLELVFTPAGGLEKCKNKEERK